MNINSIMMLVGLVKEYGPTVGRFLNEKINSDGNKQKVFFEGITKNEEIKSILKKIFADKYDSIMQEGKKVKKIRYETHDKGYISLPIDKTLSKNEINDLLKAELAENLERLESETNNSNKTEFMNKATTIVTIWIKKFIEFKNPNEQTIKKINVLHEILKPGKLTAKDIFKKLKPLFGLSSTLTLIYTAMLVTGTGLGVWANISIYFGGIPVGQVFALASVGMLLFYLTFIPINEVDKLQIVINGLYRIIDGNIENFVELIERDKEYILIQNSNQIKKEVEERTDLHIFLIKIGIALGKIDNDFAQKEMIKISTYIDNLNEREYYYSLYKELNSENNKIDIIEEIKVYIKNGPTKEERDFVYEFLFELALSDGKIKPEELEILKKILKYLELDSNIFEKYYHEYQNRENTEESKLDLYNDNKNIRIKYDYEIKECSIRYKNNIWDKEDHLGLKGVFDEKLISTIIEILERNLYVHIEDSYIIIFDGTRKDCKLLKKDALN